jgi:hypothetical protein
LLRVTEQEAERPVAAPLVGASVATAVVLAVTESADGGPAALTPFAGATLVSRLAGQLRELGVRSTVVLTRPAWEEPVREELGEDAEVVASDSAADDLRHVAELAADGALLVTYGDIAVHREALANLISDPRVSTAILAGGKRRPSAFRVRSLRNRLVSAGSAYHSVSRANGSFLGVLRVDAGDLPALAEAAERLVPLVEDPPQAWRDELERKAGLWRGAHAEPLESSDDFTGPDEEESAGDEPGPREPGAGAADDPRVAARTAAAANDVAALLVVGLVRGGARVSPVYLRRMLWARPATREAAIRVESWMDGLDEDRLLLDSAVKGFDGFFTTFFVSPYSRHVARSAARRGLTPNQVTIASLAIGILAAAAFATGDRWGLIAGAVLLQIAFVTDCVDGQLARYTRQFSKLGAYLDSVFDRAKEFIAFAGLAIGASRAGDPVWLLAGAAVALQTTRHMSDFAYMAVRAQTWPAAHPPLEQPLDASRRRVAALPQAPSRAGRLLAVWRRTDRSGAMRWLKRMIAFPIGERFALISITAALFTPRTTFVALLVWGGIGFAYMHAGRILRTFR